MKKHISQQVIEVNAEDDDDEDIFGYFAQRD